MRGLLSSDEAAAYLGVSRSFFDAHIAPVLPVVDLAPEHARQGMPRWWIADLDAYIRSRRIVRGAFRSQEAITSRE